jgi:hypothetical protein
VFTYTIIMCIVCELIFLDWLCLCLRFLTVLWILTMLMFVIALRLWLCFYLCSFVWLWFLSVIFSVNRSWVVIVWLLTARCYYSRLHIHCFILRSWIYIWIVFMFTLVIRISYCVCGLCLRLWFVGDVYIVIALLLCDCDCVFIYICVWMLMIYIYCDCFMSIVNVLMFVICHCMHGFNTRLR